jgi:hypothetical protein
MTDKHIIEVIGRATFLPDHKIQEVLDALRAAGLAVVPGWQDIASAPNGEGQFIIWCDATYDPISGFHDCLGFAAVVSGWPDDLCEPFREGYEGTWYSGDDECVLSWGRATHWMPLPAPPSQPREP